MKILHATLLGLACALPVAGFAQWQWIDKDGRKVFSDQSPPSDIPAKNILKQPGNRAAAPAAAPADSGTKAAAAPAAAAPATTAAAPAAAPAPAGAATPKLTGKDKELDDKRKAIEAAEAQKKKAEDERQAKFKAESCSQAKQAKANYDSGMRIARINGKGEREIMDDTARAAETKRLQSVIDIDCKTS